MLTDPNSDRAKTLEQEQAAQLLGLEELQKLRDAMANQKAIFLSDADMVAALRGERAEQRSPTRPIVNTDEAKNRDINVAAIPAAEVEAPRREAVTPIQTGIGIRDDKSHQSGFDSDVGAREKLIASALIATLGGNDGGDGKAIAYLKSQISSNASNADILEAMKYVADAKAHEDLKYRTRNGKTVEEVCDGNPNTNDISVEGGDEASVGGGVFGGSARRGRVGTAVVSAIVALGAIAAISKSEDAPAAAKSLGTLALLTGGTDANNVDPFSLLSPPTPPQERQSLRDLGLSLFT